MYERDKHARKDTDGDQPRGEEKRRCTEMSRNV